VENREVPSLLSTPKNNKGGKIKINKPIPGLSQRIMREQNKDLRKKVYQSLYAGKKVDSQDMFNNTNLRGMWCLPYPKHISKLKEKIESSSLKNDKKVFIH